jgi:hypothetical protein
VNVAEKDREAEARLVQANLATAAQFGCNSDFRAV